VQDDEGQAQKSPVPDGELLRLIFESATDFAIFTMDPNGITTSWNLGAERLLGFEGNEIIGKPADVIPVGITADSDVIPHAAAL
jgi:PAS domain-containing protein